SQVPGESSMPARKPKRAERRSRRRARWGFAAAAALIVVAVVLGALALTRSRPATAGPSLPAAEATFLPTVANSVPAPSDAPQGMVWIPGGEFSMGARDPRGVPEGGMQSMEDARPIHRVYVDGFWLDRTDVTNEEFVRFVKATGYVTVAERKPRQEDYP